MMKQTKLGSRIAAIMLLAALLISLLPNIALAESYSAYVSSDNAVIYKDSGLVTKYGTLSKGTIVVAESESNTVSRVVYRDSTGYCASSDLTAVSDIAKPAYVNVSGAKVYIKPDKDSKSAAIAKNEKVNVVAVSGAWALIEKDGCGAYIYEGYLTYDDDAATPAPTATPKPDVLVEIPAVVTSASLTVYKSAETSSEVLGTLKYGANVTVLAYNKTWAYILKNGNYGYCDINGLSKETDATPTPEVTATATPAPTAAVIPAVVSAESLDVYKSADTSSKVLGTLKKGAEVNVVSVNGKWAYVEKNNNYGYCAASGLTKETEATPSPSATPAPTPNADVIPAIVSAEKVKVYKTADTSSKVLGTLKKGAEVNVVSINGKWAYIEKSGNYGYCKLKALSKASDATPTPAPTADDDYRKKYNVVKFTATVIYEYAPVYADPKATTASEKLALGTQVDVYAYNSEWAYMGIGESRGFIQIKYLSSAEYTALSSGDSGTNVQNMQEALEKLGYFDGIPGGTFSTMTTSAVKRFQSAMGVTQTGAADVATLRVLYGGYAPASSMITTPLSSGGNSASVERMQTRLYYKGYLSKSSSIDGEYGSLTIAAVKLFQTVAELTGDGEASVATLRTLYSNDAPSLPSGTNPVDYTPPSSGGDNPGLLKMPNGLGSTLTSLPENATSAQKIEYAIYIAQNQLGKPYIYGTAGPNSFDCSGFTTYCYKKVSVSLGRSAYAQGYQSSSGTKIEGISNLKRGDIVCFNTISDSDLSDHVGIYLGEGYFIHASSGSSNGRQVCVSNLNTGYYNRVFSWGRRPIE